MKNGSAISNYAYARGLAGNRTTVPELTGRTVGYAYDALYRLTAETVTADPHNSNGVASCNRKTLGSMPAITAHMDCRESKAITKPSSSMIIWSRRE